MALTEAQRRFALGEEEERPRPPLTAAQRAFALGEDPEPGPAEPPRKPTFGENVRTIVSGPAAGARDMLNLPNFVSELAQTAAEKIPLPGLGFPKGLAASEQYQRGRPDLSIPSTQDFGPTKAADDFLTYEADNLSAPVEAARTFGELAGPGGLSKLIRGGTGLAMDISQGLFGAGGEQLGQIVGNEVGGDAGEAIGAMTGAVAGKGRGNKQKVAASLIRKSAQDPDAAYKYLKESLESGRSGTLADLTADPGIYRVEAAAARRDPRFAQQRDEYVSRLRSDLADEALAPLEGADPVRAQTAAASRSGNVSQRVKKGGRLERARAQADVNAAKAQESASQQPVASQRRPSETSEAMSGEVRRAYEAQKAKTDAAYDAFRGSAAELDMAPGIASGEKYLRNLGPAERAAFLRKYGTMLNDRKVWQDTPDVPQVIDPATGQPFNKPAAPGASATPRDYDAYMQRLNAAIESADTPADARRLRGYQQSFDQGLAQGNAPANELYSAARAERRAQGRVFEEGRLGQALGNEVGGPSTFMDRLPLKDSAGKEVAQELRGALGENITESRVVEHLKAVAATGNGVDADFVARYGDVIDSLPPESAAAFRRAATGKTAALSKAAKAEAAAKRSADKQKKLDKAVQQSIVTKYADNPGKTIDDLLKNDGKDLVRLGRFMRKNDELDSFRANLAERLERKYLTKTDGSVEVIKNKIQAFDQQIGRLLESNLISPDEALSMRNAMSKSLTLDQRRKIAKAWFDNDGGVTEKERMLASVIAAIALKMAPIGGGQSLILANATRRAALKAITKADNAGAIQGIENFMLNPQKWIDEIDNIDSVEQAVLRAITRATLAGSIAEDVRGQE